MSACIVASAAEPRIFATRSGSIPAARSASASASIFSVKTTADPIVRNLLRTAGNSYASPARGFTKRSGGGQPRPEILQEHRNELRRGARSEVDRARVEDLRAGRRLVVRHLRRLARAEDVGDLREHDRSLR